MLTVLIPLRTTSGNRQSGEHFIARFKRRRAERAAVDEALAPFEPLRGPLIVKLTRVSPRTAFGWQPLDEHDNLRAALKSPVDAVANWLGRDDSWPGLRWEYGQREGDWGVEVDVRRGIS